MSRIPFWLVILFAVILCTTGGVALLHRAGIIDNGINNGLTASQTLPPETGLLITSVERRNPGILIVEGRSLPDARIVATYNGERLLEESATAKGVFSLSVRLPDSGSKAWKLLSLQAGDHSPAPLLVGPARKGDTGLLAFTKQNAEDWQLLTPPNALAITTVIETATGDWQLSAQHPSAGALLLHIYSNDKLVATQTTDAAQFKIILPKNQRPQNSLRIDAYNAASLAPVVRLIIKLPLEGLFERVAIPGQTPTQALWVWRDAAAQQADAKEALPGQIIPVAGNVPAKVN